LVTRSVWRTCITRRTSARKSPQQGCCPSQSNPTDTRCSCRLKIGLKSARFNGLGLGVFFFIIYGAYGLAFYYGTTLLLQGRITSGEIVNVFFSILIGAFSLAQLAPNLQAISFARGAATEIYATIDRVPVIDSASEAGLKPESVKGLIELENIDFIYPSR
jgi:ATP-binding cassette subfamily B (MDR/TAP) protein 1